MDYYTFCSIIAKISFGPWRLKAGLLGSSYYLQWKFETDGEVQAGRKWYVSKHSTRSEVVQTALLAVFSCLEHEAREQFLYCGRAIFGPHQDVEMMLTNEVPEDRRSSHHAV